MGQLIKLQDYISRYEMDPFRYPAQYARLKKQQWDKLKDRWENREEQIQLVSPIGNEHVENKRSTSTNIIRRLFKKGKMEEEETVAKQPINKESLFQFMPELTYYPDSIDELKQLFLDQLFSFQMKWASSTIVEKSFPDQRYYRNENLKYLLQRFPDTFLFLYEPIFLLKKAPIEMEVILISPTEVWCLSFLDQEKDAVYLGSNEKFWIKRSIGGESKILNPVIALNRMSKIIKQLLNKYQLDIPLKKAVICRDGYIDFPNAPADLVLLEKRSYPTWFQQQRKLQSPLKHVQLKTAKILLDYCQTTCSRRPEWVEQEGNEE